jgi:hypothetical protein
MNVEVLTEADMQWFVETAAVNMLRDEVQREELIDVDTLYKLAQMGLETQTAFVAKVDGVCVGAIGGLLLPNIFNPRLSTLAEVFWYVLPEHRQSRAGLLLLNAFTARGVEVADETTLCLLGSSEIKMKTLEKRGFYLGEFAFRKENRRN